MHFQPFVLLAVLIASDTVGAGLIRQNDRVRRYPRFLNTTSTSDPALTTLGENARNTPPARNDNLGASAQVGSVPAVAGGPGAATSVSLKSSTTGTDTPTSVPSKPDGSASPPSSAASKQVGSVPAFGSGPGAATAQESQTQRKTEIQSPTRAFPLRPSGAIQTQSVSAQSPGGVNTTSAVAAKPSPATDSTRAPQPPRGSSTQTSSSSALASTSKSGNGNIAMALGFNSIFDGMTPESSCNPSNPNEAVACVNGQYARCGLNSKYALAKCPSGQQCFALPLGQDAKGITIQCASMENASQQLGQGAKPPKPTIASPVTSPKPQEPTEQSQPPLTTTTITTTSSSSRSQPAPSPKPTKSPKPEVSSPTTTATKTSTDTQRQTISNSLTASPTQSAKNTDSPKPQAPSSNGPPTTTSSDSGPIIISVPNLAPSSNPNKNVVNNDPIPDQSAKAGKESLTLASKAAITTPDAVTNCKAPSTVTVGVITTTVFLGN